MAANTNTNQVRDRVCLHCGHAWTSAVVFSPFAVAISGERREQCAQCHSSEVQSGPMRDDTPTTSAEAEPLDSADELARHLEGWSIDCQITEQGDNRTPTKFSCVVRNSAGASTRIDFTKGAGNRRWRTRKECRGFAHMDIQHTWLAAYYKSGEPIAQKLYTAKLAGGDLAMFLNVTIMEPPTLAEVLSAMVSDANCVRFGQSFEDFAAECGYDTDSRAAERIYNACRDEWSALAKLGNVDTLAELLGE